MTNTRQSIDPARRRSLVTSLTLGVLGLEVAPSIQNDLHRVLDFEPAQGWDHQISDGGELTARYGLAVQSMLYRDRGTGFASAEVQSTLKGNLGYLTDLGWNLSGRWGRLRSPWWSHGPQLSEFAEKSAPQAPRAAAQRPESYLWAGLGVRLRLYNAFLQGQFRHSAVTLDRARLRSWLAEAWLGYTHELPGGLRISYVLRGQTAEIKRGPAARRAAWGGLIVSQAF